MSIVAVCLSISIPVTSISVVLFTFPPVPVFPLFSEIFVSPEVLPPFVAFPLLTELDVVGEVATLLLVPSSLASTTPLSYTSDIFIL